MCKGKSLKRIKICEIYEDTIYIFEIHLCIWVDGVEYKNFDCNCKICMQRKKIGYYIFFNSVDFFPFVFICSDISIKMAVVLQGPEDDSEYQAF
ncbi:MAG: hypothetical protein HWN67_19815 [Candidatus Helarchaeota archaeon]|nr:hypothetical protein [Candidatus Helarchaeota archaeon]